MPYFLLQASYTDKAWAVLSKKPQNREPVIREAITKLGGTLEGIWLAFGEYDLVAIFTAPDNTTAAAFAIAATAGGAVKTAKTTPLMTCEEGIVALRKAGKSGYRPPK